MGGIDAGVAILLLSALVAGITIGIVVVVSIASRREDRLYSLGGKAPDASCRGARWLTGVTTRGPRTWEDAGPHHHSEDLHGQEPHR
jgi:hypothetical protein